MQVCERTVEHALHRYDELVSIHLHLSRCDCPAPLAQSLPIPAVPLVAETAEPLITVRPANDGSYPHHFPTLAAPIARCTHVIQLFLLVDTRC